MRRSIWSLGSGEHTEHSACWGLDLLLHGLSISLLLVAAFLLLVLPAGKASSQQYDSFGNLCDGYWSGFNCICPDGSLANGIMDGNLVHGICASAEPQYRYQQQQSVGDYCANGSTCPPGSFCHPRGSGCVWNGRTVCGYNSCSPGYYCGSQNACLAEGTNDCGNGKSCSGDTKCSRDKRHCLEKDTVDCDSHFCNKGEKCGSGKKCLASDEVDCGSGKSCSAGNVCRRGGGCATREELAAERAAEQERKRELAAQKAREAEDRKRQIAEKKAEQQRLAEEKQRKQEEEAGRRAEERKQEAARRTVEAGFDKRLLAIMNDPKETPASRQIAAIALGKDPSSIRFGNGPAAAGRNASSIPYAATPAERELAALTVGQDRVATANPPKSVDDLMRAIMNDPKETSASRQIAAIGLSIDPASLGLNKARASSTGSLTPAQLQFLKENAVTLTPSRTQEEQKQEITRREQQQLSAIEQIAKITGAGVTGFNAPSRVGTESERKKQEQKIASTILSVFEIKAKGLVQKAEERHKKGLEYMTENPQVQEAIKKIYILSASTAVRGKVGFTAADIALKLKSAAEGMQEVGKGDRYMGTLKLVNVFSSELASLTDLPPGSSTVLNLSGAAATAYIYGFFFGL